MSEKSFARLLDLTLAVANYPHEELAHAETKVHTGLIAALREELEALGLDWRELDAQAQRVRQEAIQAYTAALMQRHEQRQARAAERLAKRARAGVHFEWGDGLHAATLYQAMKAARERSLRFPGPVEVRQVGKEGASVVAVFEGGERVERA